MIESRCLTRRWLRGSEFEHPIVAGWRGLQTLTIIRIHSFAYASRVLRVDPPHIVRPALHSDICILDGSVDWPCAQHGRTLKKYRRYQPSIPLQMTFERNFQDGQILPSGNSCF